MLHIDVNYLPIAGSPFPVFFSNPIDPAEAAAAEAAAAAAAAAAASGGGGGAGGGLPSPADPTVAAMAAAAKQAVAGATAFSDLAQRTVYVSNLSASVPQEQYKQLLSIAGRFKSDVKLVGEGASASLVFEFFTVEDADAAVKMSGMTILDRAVLIQVRKGLGSLDHLPSIAHYMPGNMGGRVPQISGTQNDNVT